MVLGIPLTILLGLKLNLNIMAILIGRVAVELALCLLYLVNLKTTSWDHSGHYTITQLSRDYPKGEFVFSTPGADVSPLYGEETPGGGDKLGSDDYFDASVLATRPHHQTRFKDPYQVPSSHDFMYDYDPDPATSAAPPPHTTKAAHELEFEFWDPEEER